MLQIIILEHALNFCSHWLCVLIEKFPNFVTFQQHMVYLFWIRIDRDIRHQSFGSNSKKFHKIRTL